MSIPLNLPLQPPPPTPIVHTDSVGHQSIAAPANPAAAKIAAMGMVFCTRKNAPLVPLVPLLPLVPFVVPFVPGAVTLPPAPGKGTTLDAAGAALDVCEAESCDAVTLPAIPGIEGGSRAPVGRPEGATAADADAETPAEEAEMAGLSWTASAKGFGLPPPLRRSAHTTLNSD